MSEKARIVEIFKKQGSYSREKLTDLLQRAVKERTLQLTALRIEWERKTDKNATTFREQAIIKTLVLLEDDFAAILVAMSALEAENVGYQ